MVFMSVQDLLVFLFVNGPVLNQDSTLSEYFVNLLTVERDLSFESVVRRIDFAESKNGSISTSELENGIQERLTPT